MKIYTKTGDEGLTGLYGGGRVPKDHARICAYGSVDELNATLGLLKAQSQDPMVDAVLVAIQNDLFCIGAELATLEPDKFNVSWSAELPTLRLEEQIDHWEEGLPTLKNFILPGGCVPAAACHVARTTCRRCEREIVHLSKVDPSVKSAHIVIYLNRLSDLLFVMARRLNQIANLPDVEWIAKKS